MRQRREEFVLESSCPLRGHTRATLGLQHLVALLTDQLHGFDSLGVRQVAGQLGVADEATGVVAQGRDRDIGPKRRTVLAHAPPGIDKAALLGGYPQLVLRPPTLPGFGRIKSRKMAANDFARRVPLDPLSPDVPSGHQAIGIEHEDCVFADAFHQKAKTLLALA